MEQLNNDQGKIHKKHFKCVQYVIKKLLNQWFVTKDTFSVKCVFSNISLSKRNKKILKTKNMNKKKLDKLK